MVGVMLANPSAFFNFGAAFAQGLAHLLRHQTGQTLLVATQLISQSPHPLAAMLQGCASPGWPGILHLFNDLGNLSG